MGYCIAPSPPAFSTCYAALTGRVHQGCVHLRRPSAASMWEGEPTALWYLRSYASSASSHLFSFSYQDSCGPTS